MLHPLLSELMRPGTNAIARGDLAVLPFLVLITVLGYTAWITHGALAGRTMTTTILITGATGLLGPYVAEACSTLGTVVTSGRRSGDVTADLTDESAVIRLLAAVRPDVVIHAAAMTDVDGCELDPESAVKLNTMAPLLLARHLRGDVQLVSFSTDQVYPDRCGPHAEPNVDPVNIYGRTKLEGERPVLARRERGLVLRTNFFAASRTPGRPSLSDWVASSLAAREPVVLFEDVLFSPLHASTVGEIVVELVARGAAGVFNLGSTNGCSKLKFGQLVAGHLGLSVTNASPGRSKGVATRAPRPADLRMLVTKLEGVLQRQLPAVEEEVKKL